MLVPTRESMTEDIVQWLKKWSLHDVQAIQRAQPIIASGISQKAGVRVVFGGTRAYTDGMTIYQPLPADDNPAYGVLVMGRTAHEAAHILDSQPIMRLYSAAGDQDRLSNFRGTPVPVVTPTHLALTKLFEEIRIEDNVGQKLFPGYGPLFRETIAELVRMKEFAEPNDKSTPAAIFQMYVLYQMRATFLNQEGLAPYADAALGRFQRMFSPSALVRTDAVLAQAPMMKTTQDAADIAIQLLSLLENESAEESATSDDERADLSDDMDMPDPSTHACANDASASGKGPTVEANSGSRTIPAADERPLALHSAASEQTSIEAVGMQVKHRQNAAQVLDAAEIDFLPHVGDMLASALHDMAEADLKSYGGNQYAQEPLSQLAIDPSTVLSSVRSLTMALNARLRGAFQVEKTLRRGNKTFGTRLDRRRLALTVKPNAAVFSTHRRYVVTDVVIELLTDRSTSMRGEQLTIALQSTLALQESLQGMAGVSVRSSVFPGYGQARETLIDYNEAVRSHANRIRAVIASGGTPLLEALFNTVSTLVVRPEARKIVLVLTDGLPPSSEFERCRALIASCWKGGVEVYGVGVRVDGMSEIFPIYCNVTDLSTLPSKLFAMLERVFKWQTA